MIFANIADALLGLVETVISGVLGLIPSMDPPSFLTDGQVADAVDEWGSFASPMGHWVPFSTIAACIAAVLAVWLLMIGVQIVLKVYSMIRGGS